MYVKFLSIAAVLAALVAADGTSTPATPAPAQTTPTPPAIVKPTYGGDKDKDKYGGDHDNKYGGDHDHDKDTDHKDNDHKYGGDHDNDHKYGGDHDTDNKYGGDKDKAKDYGRKDTDNKYGGGHDYDGQRHEEKSSYDDGQYHAGRYNGGGSYGGSEDTYRGYGDTSHGYLLRRDNGDGSSSYGDDHAYAASSPPSYDDGQYHPDRYPGDNGQYHADKYNTWGSSASGSYSGYGDSSNGYLVRRDDGSGSGGGGYDNSGGGGGGGSSGGSGYDNSGGGGGGSGYDNSSGQSYSPPAHAYSPSKSCVDGHFRCSYGSTKFYKCDHSQWVTFDCAPGTVCHPNTPSAHVILCDYA